MADSRTLELILRLKDEASSALSGVGKRLETFQKSIEPAADASRKFALGLGAAGAAVTGFGALALNAAADMEQTKVAFTTMLGSAQQANEFISQLINFAKRTPFELRGLEEASKQLLAYGIEQKKIIPDLQVLGDIASGVGMDKLPNLILAFGQVKAATKLTGMELRQFTEAGVPLLEALSQTLKKPVAEIQKMVSEGQIGFPQVEAALASLTSEGGRFNNLMENQSKTLSGMVSNLKDAWNIFLTGEGQKLIEWAKQFVAIAIDIVQNHLPRWIERISQLVNWLGQHKEVLIIVAGAITGALIPAVMSAIASFYLFASALAPFVLGGVIVSGIVAGVLWIIQHWDMLKAKALELPVIGDVLRSIKAAMDVVWDAIVTYLWPAFQELWNTIKNELWPALKELWDALQPLKPAFDLILKAILALIGAGLLVLVETLKTIILSLTAVIELFVKLTTFITQVATGVIKGITDTVNTLANAFKTVVDWLDQVISKWNTWKASGASLNPFSSSFKLPGFAEGGIVTRPTVAMVGEGGEPEAIIPFSKMKNFGVGGGIVVNVYGDVSGQELIEKVSEGIMNSLRLNARLPV